MQRYLRKKVYDDNLELKKNSATFGESTSKALDEFLRTRNNSLFSSPTNININSSSNNINHVDEAICDDFHSSLSANNNHNFNSDDDFNYWNDDNYEDDGGRNIVNSNYEGFILQRQEMASISKRESILDLIIPSYSIVTLTKHLTNLSIHADIKKKMIMLK